MKASTKLGLKLALAVLAIFYGLAVLAVFGYSIYHIQDHYTAIAIASLALLSKWRD